MIKRSWIGVGLCLLVWLASGPIKSTLAAQPDEARVQQAIDKGVQYLYSQEPKNTFEEAWKFSHYSYVYDQQLHHATGNYALSLWALLACGESYQNPKIYRRLQVVISNDTSYLFDRGMRAQMLAELPASRWAGYVNRDGLFLKAALSQYGNFVKQYIGQKNLDAGDNAHGQYGVLGLAGLQRAGWSKISIQDWKRIDSYWRYAQYPVKGRAPTGWGIYSFNENHPSGINRGLDSHARIRGPMTAGGVSVLCVTERMLRGKKMDAGKKGVSRQLLNGINWLDQHFSLTDQSEDLDRYYYFFTIQSLSRYLGYRRLNNIDLYEQITNQILSEQNSDGSWSGGKGPLVSTSFALLYLSRSKDPLGLCKVRLYDQSPGKGRKEARWNNRPHDLWNFVDYASDRYEVSTTWQIAELEQPLAQLRQSPIMYMASDEQVTLSKEHISKLQAYINLGGLLIVNCDNNASAARKGFRKLAKTLFQKQGYKLTKVDKTHPMRTAHALKVALPFEVVENGVRPLMVLFITDVGKDLQRFNTTSQSFNALSNIYLYVSGLQPQKPRHASELLYGVGRTNRQIKVARLQYDGPYDPEPASMLRLKSALSNKHQVNMSLDVVKATGLSDHKIAFMSILEPVNMPENQLASLKTWIGQGGSLWVDATGGGVAATKALQAFMKKLYPGPDNRPSRLSRQSPIISGSRLFTGYDNKRVNYRPFAIRSMGAVSDPRLETIQINGRPAVVFSTMDLTAGLAGLKHWGIFGFSPRSAMQLAINGCLLTIKR